MRVVWRLIEIAGSMNRLFDKKFVYNWIVNPDKPGLAYFLDVPC
jgi:hypothetical protein